MSFEQVEEILQRVGQISVSGSTVWRQTQKWGGCLAELELEGRERAGAVSSVPDQWGQEMGQDVRLGASMDGTMIHVRGEGWKEVKVGCVFKVETQEEADSQTGEQVEIGHARQNSYISHLGGPDAFGESLWAEAQRRSWGNASATQVIGDGAAWIWNLTATHFYKSQQVVDWYHAVEHLAAVARLLYGEGTPAARRFFKGWETTLYQGHAERLAAKLNILAEQQPNIADELRREAGYFANNHRRMKYLELRSEGWVIGSGMVESAGKQLKARMAGPGMQWSRSGAENMLPVRTAIMSSRFDELWQQVHNSPPI